MRHAIYKHGLFLKELVRTPRNIGAICPMSNTTAKAVCSMLPKERKGIILEVGPGTGALTKEISRYTTPEEFYLMERSMRLCTYLKNAFPSLHIIHADAANLGLYLPDNTFVDTIVCSIPLVSLHNEDRKNILEQFHNALKHGGKLLVLSYNLRCSNKIRMAGFTSVYHRIILRNIPPVRIDMLIPA